MGCCRRNAAPKSWQRRQAKFVEKAKVNIAANRPTMHGLVKSPCQVIATSGDFLSFSVARGAIALHLPDGSAQEAVSVLAKCPGENAATAIGIVNLAYKRIKQLAKMTNGQRVTLSFLKTFVGKK